MGSDVKKSFVRRVICKAKARVVHDDILFLEGSWWFCPAKCRPLRNKVNEVVIHCVLPPHGLIDAIGLEIAEEFCPWSLWNLLI
ncbi:hypothetical protein Golax_016716, partial [Gossypium laxum]|nr:hypothetical protein [Gossypium laxum]